MFSSVLRGLSVYNRLLFSPRGEIGGNGTRFRPSFFPFVMLLLGMLCQSCFPPDPTVATSGQSQWLNCFILLPYLSTSDSAADLVILMDVHVCHRFSPSSQRWPVVNIHRLLLPVIN